MNIDVILDYHICMKKVRYRRQTSEEGGHHNGETEFFKDINKLYSFYKIESADLKIDFDKERK